MEQKLRQRRKLPDLGRQAAQLIVLEVKPRQRRKLADLGRQAAQLVAMEKKLRQSREVTDLRWQGAEGKPAQVQTQIAPATAGFDFHQSLVVGDLMRGRQGWVLHGLVSCWCGRNH